ncbi:MAG: sulfatase [Candidatus Altiarchaeota archaeon]
MLRKNRNIVLAGTVIATAILLAAYGHTREKKDYNVILITIDTLRADHVGAYGYVRDTTPFLDELASKSILYENAYSQAPWTRPSMASMLTSLYPRHSGVIDESGKSFLDKRLVTLQEVFNENNYKTAGFVSNANLRSDFGFNQGFDQYRDNLPWRPGSVMLGNALAWIMAHGKSDRFFAWIHLNEPHGPYMPPDVRYSFMFSGDKPELIKPWNTSRKKVMKPPRYDKEIGRNLTGEDVQRMIDLYDGEIRYVDDQLRIFYNGLAEAGLDENTIIVVTADHGEEFLDHGGLYHGHSMYNELIRIPLIIHVPGLEGRRADEEVELIGLFPTLLELTGLGVEHRIEGVSYLSPVMHPVYGETDFRSTHQSMMLEEGIKVIHDWDSNTSISYDIVSDRKEENPVEVDYEHLSRMGAYREYVFSPEGAEEIRPETLEHLREIGYII